jgi:hypothetical protein
MAGGLESFPVGLAQAGQDVLTVQVALGLDGVAVQDLLDHRHRRGPERACPVGEPAP